MNTPTHTRLRFYCSHPTYFIFFSFSPVMTTVLEQLKQYTTVVADTGDFESKCVVLEIDTRV
jgi:hypothetical protein